MNILVIRFSSLGDLVTLEPTFRAIRHFYKDARITFITTVVGKGLYQDTDYFDEYIIHNKLFNTIQQIPKIKFDLVINLQCNKPSHYINLFINKNRTINKSFNLMQKILKIKTHSKSPKELLSSCGIKESLVNQYFEGEGSTISLPVKCNSEITGKIQTKFGTKPIIAISTGSSKKWESKKWGKHNYKELISKLSEKFGIILVGTKLEEEDAKFIEKDYSKYIVNYVNQTNLTQLKAILHTADLYIGNDSGPTHIAASVGTSTITIFGSTDIKHCVAFERYKGTHTYLKPSDKITCHPCYKSICPTQHECMKDITVEQVYLKIKKFLGITNEFS